MSDLITVRGFVATDPNNRTMKSGQRMSSFRLASTERRFDKQSQGWVDGTTNWYTVNMFRALAENAGMCLHKGQPVIVTGRLRIRDWQTEEKSGTAIEIEADTVGHDLVWGTSLFHRVNPKTSASSDAEDQQDQEDDADEASEQSPAAAAPSHVDTETGEITDGAGESTGFTDPGPSTAGVDDWEAPLTAHPAPVGAY